MSDYLEFLLSYGWEVTLRKDARGDFEIRCTKRFVQILRIVSSKQHSQSKFDLFDAEYEHIYNTLKEEDKL